jgi:hypothetical protein
MPIESGTIRGRVDSALLDKADRLFQNSDDSLWTELLQNARRAGANSVEITLQAAMGSSGRSVVTVWDNGVGIDDFQKLITLGGSGWSNSVQYIEDPAGIGFFSLCRSDVTVQSGHRTVNITPAVFLGREEARIGIVEQYFQGTRLVFTRDSAVDSLKAALERATAFCPLAVKLNGALLPQYDFLEGAVYREQIDGIEVGFAPEFKHNFGWSDQNWNFYGARIREPFPSFDGIIVSEDRKPCSLHARFNVLETGRVKLQLPDRRAVIQDRNFERFVGKAKAAAYRFFQTVPRHALPYANWREARELGVILPEAAPLLHTWCPRPADDTTEPVFDPSELHIPSDLTKVWIVDQDTENQHTLAGALHSGSRVDGILHEARKQWEGYEWYQKLPRIAGCTVLINDLPSEEWPQGSSKRPDKIELELDILQSGKEKRRLRLPALVHVDESQSREIDFVAVRNSPWDNDDLAGPFSIVDFLMSACFCASDDSEADSWMTQRDNFTEEVEREVNAYFRGPKATLLALLRKGIGWDANRLATELGIHEIHFKRITSDAQQWEIELSLR